MLQTTRFVYKLSTQTEKNWSLRRQPSSKHWVPHKSFSELIPHKRLGASFFKIGLVGVGATALILYFVFPDTVAQFSPFDLNLFTAQDELGGNKVPTFSARVLLVGDSQSGKSTLIKKLHTIAGQRVPITLKIGTGGGAATHKTSIYHINFPIKELTLLNENGVDLDWRKALYNPSLFDDLADDKRLNFEKRGTIAKVDLHLIDTPGLKGTDENDEESMFNLLQTLSDIGSVDCVFLVNKGTNYGPNFRESLLYYQDMLGSNVPIHIAHTRYTSDDILSDLKSNIDPYTSSPRIKEFAKFFPHIEAEHWLMDSLPKSERPFRELLSTYTIYRWLASLENKQNVSTKNLRFQKTTKLRNIDERAQIHNHTLREHYASELKQKITGLQALSRKIRILSKDTEDQKEEIDTKTADLNQKNSDDFIQTEEKHVKHYWDLWKPWQQYEIQMTSGYPIVKVEKEITNSVPDHAYWVPDSESKYGKDMNIKTYSVKIASKFWTGCFAYIKLFTYSRYKYAEEINTLRRKIEKLETDFKRNKSDINTLKVDYQEVEHNSKELGDKIEYYDIVDPMLLDVKIDFDLYRRVQNIYNSKIINSSKPNDFNMQADKLTEAFYKYRIGKKE